MGSSTASDVIRATRWSKSAGNVSLPASSRLFHHVNLRMIEVTRTMPATQARNVYCCETSEMGINTSEVCQTMPTTTLKRSRFNSLLGSNDGYSFDTLLYTC